MSVKETSDHCFTVTQVTPEKLTAVLPWLQDGATFNQLYGTSFAIPSDLKKLQTGAEVVIHIGMFLQEGDGRSHTIVDIEVEIEAGLLRLKVHPGQPDVNLRPLADAVDNYR